MYFVCTQQLGFPDEKEHITDKRQRSHRHLFNVAHLLENVIESLEMDESVKYHRNILDYMFRVQEVVGKYCKVYFNYNINAISNILKDESEIKPKIITMCKFIIALTKFIKVRVSVLLRNDPQAHDLIHSIFGRKVNWRIQEYLVTINYWVKKMSSEEKAKYHLK